MTTTPEALPPMQFSRYQKGVTALLAFLQFAVIIDFMIMSPLGALIMPALDITPRQFGMIVSAYAFSAGISGLLTAGFADRFDRKKLLLFFYSGFIVGTLWCGLAQSFSMLLLARMVTGIFAGVIGSIVLAIAADLFSPQLRGRVMGFIQTAFAASQVLGLPMGLYLSNNWGWHSAFLALVVIGGIGGLVIILFLKPVDAHLNAPQERSPFMHLLHTVTEPRYLMAFVTTALLTTGGYMLMPFSSAFTISNLGIDAAHLPTIYLATGLGTIFVGPLVGKAADSLGKVPVFMVGCVLTIIMVLIYTHLQATSLPMLIVINVLLFLGIFSRLIPFQALMSSVPEPSKRGSFNAVSAAVQQLSGGCASLIAGHLIAFGSDGKLLGFEMIGYVLVGTTVIAAVLVWSIQRQTLQRSTVTTRL